MSVKVIIGVLLGLGIFCVLISYSCIVVSKRNLPPEVLMREDDEQAEWLRTHPAKPLREQFGKNKNNIAEKTEMEVSG